MLQTKPSIKTEHIKTKKDYGCPVFQCSKRYTDPSSLRKHVFHEHGETVWTFAKANKERKKAKDYGLIGIRPDGTPYAMPYGASSSDEDREVDVCYTTPPPDSTGEHQQQQHQNITKLPTLREHHQEDDENCVDLIEEIIPCSNESVERQQKQNNGGGGNSLNNSPATNTSQQQNVGNSVENQSKNQSPSSSIQNPSNTSQLQRQSSLEQKQHFLSNNGSPSGNSEGGIINQSKALNKSLASVAPMLQYSPQQGFNWQDSTGLQPHSNASNNPQPASQKRVTATVAPGLRRQYEDNSQWIETISDSNSPITQMQRFSISNTPRNEVLMQQQDFRQQQTQQNVWPTDTGQSTTRNVSFNPSVAAFPQHQQKHPSYFYNRNTTNEDLMLSATYNSIPSPDVSKHLQQQQTFYSPQHSNELSCGATVATNVQHVIPVDNRVKSKWTQQQNEGFALDNSIMPVAADYTVENTPVQQYRHYGYHPKFYYQNQPTQSDSTVSFMTTAETSFSGYPQQCHSQQQQQQNFQQKQQQNKQQNSQHLYHNNQMLPSLLSPETSPLQTSNTVVPSNYIPQQHQKLQQRQQEYHQHQQYQQTHPSSVIANTQQHYDVYQQQHHLMFGQNYQHYNQQIMGQHSQTQQSQHNFPKNNIPKNNISRQQNVGVNYNNYPTQQHYSQQKHQQQHLEGRRMFEQTSFNYQQQQCSNYQQQKHQQTLPLQHQQQHYESTQQQTMLPQQQTMVCQQQQQLPPQNLPSIDDEDLDEEASSLISDLQISKQQR
uniref:C2H2-type domain-containing protein n=1 Tax=Meloidogyne enterolobii TaxID=390850 RepID=A0A6V7W575_MELEN|nr:unnamed protein product [Meloidogyne enterolobii]